MLNETHLLEKITLLNTLIENCPPIVQPHVETICKILLKHLKCLQNSAKIVSVLFKSFENLTRIDQPIILHYIEKIVPIMLKVMQDKSYSIKRESAVISFVGIIKNTGYVVLPYYHYP